MFYFIATTFILFIPILINACPEVKTCLHNGVFNNKTCTCDCFASYTGYHSHIIDRDKN